MRSARSILVVAGLALLASVLPVVPVEKTSVVAPVPSPDGTHAPPPTRGAFVAVAELISGRTGVRYALNLASLGVLAAMTTITGLIGRLLVRRLASRRS